MTAAAHGSQNAGETSEIGPRGAAVITPYFLEPLEVLERCHRSCKNQDGDWPLRHVMVADGHPQAAIDAWDVDHITLPRAHGDNGNSPRCIGAISAINQGYWPILFLDADNWFKPWHLKAVVALHRRHPRADVLHPLEAFDLQPVRLRLLRRRLIADDDVWSKTSCGVCNITYLPCNVARWRHPNPLPLCWPSREFHHVRCTF